jgi:hypothetical protein
MSVLLVSCDSCFFLILVMLGVADADTPSLARASPAIPFLNLQQEKLLF